MNDADAYERYLAEFGKRLEAVASPSPKPRRMRLMAAAIGTTAVIAVGVLLAAPSSDNEINVFAQARAALPSAGELLHLETRKTTSLLGADDAAQQRFAEFASRHHDEYAPQTFEQWSVADRWRVAVPNGKVSPKMFAGEPYYPGFYISDEMLRQIGLIDDVIGPIQEAYAEGVDTLYVAKLGLIIRSDLEQAGWEHLPPFPGGIYTGSPTGLGSDPVAQIRRWLDHGSLRDAGMGEVDGRRVYRLVPNDGSFDIEFDLDAQTYEPVRVRELSRWVGGPNSPHPPETMVTDVDFRAFETLPLNPETAQLLEIDAPPATPVIDALGPDDQPPRNEG